MSIFQPKNVPPFVQERFKELAGSVDKLNAATSAKNIWFQLKSMSKLCESEYNNLSNYISSTPFYKITSGAQLQDRNAIALQRIDQSVRTNEVSPFETITATTSGNTNIILDENAGLRSGGAFGSNRITISKKIIKPMIDNIKVQKQGELGTTSKCTITIIVSTVGEGLAQLQKCFFIPGMSVRVEWGYYAGGNPNPYPVQAPDTLTDGEATDVIRKHVEKNKGLYYGLQGRVTNFSWTLESAQYWICTLEIISAAESKMEKPMVEPCKNSDGSLGPSVGFKTTNTENKEEDIFVSVLNTKLQELATLAKNTPAPVGDSQAQVEAQRRLHELRIAQGGPPQKPQTLLDVEKQQALLEDLKANASKYKQNPAEMFVEFQQYEGPVREVSGNTSGIINSIKSFFTETLELGVTETYISFAVLEALISKYVLSDADDDVKQTILSSKGVLLPVIRGKSVDVLQQSVDPRVCLIPGAPELKYILDEEGGFNYYQDKTAYVQVGNKKYVRLSKIRLNVMMLTRILGEIENPKTGNFQLNTFMDRVLREISTATGSHWDLILTPVPDDKKTPENESNEQLTVVDVKTTPTDNDTGNKAEAFVVPSRPENSIISDLKLDMKMTSAMRTQALYNPGNSGGMSDKQNPCSGKAARAWSVVQGGSDPDLNKASKPIKLKPCSPDKNSPEANKDPYTTRLTTFRVAMEEGMENGISDSNVTNALNFLQKEMAEMMEDPDHPHCDGVPLPVECTMTFNFGIGGIGFGQLITTDFIPKEIREKFNWQITSVEHSLTGEGWTMQVNTVPRVKPK